MEEHLDSPGWALAEQVTGAVRRRFPADVLAVGALGALAHGDDTGATEVELLVVTYRPASGPPPGGRRVAGTLVRLRVQGAEEHLRRAGSLTPSWPLTADRYLTVRTLHDPTGWLARPRDEHLSRLARARPIEFTGPARQAWYRGSSAHTQATRLAEWYETDAALQLLGRARLAVATVTGLLSRTYYRDSGDAVRRAGVAGADMTEIGRLLREQATELAARGRPVDGSIDDLLGG